MVRRLFTLLIFFFVSAHHASAGPCDTREVIQQILFQRNTRGYQDTFTDRLSNAFNHPDSKVSKKLEKTFRKFKLRENKQLADYQKLSSDVAKIIYKDDPSILKLFAQRGMNTAAEENLARFVQKQLFAKELMKGTQSLELKSSATQSLKSFFRKIKLEKPLAAYQNYSFLLGGSSPPYLPTLELLKLSDDELAVVMMRGLDQAPAEIQAKLLSRSAQQLKYNALKKSVNALCFSYLGIEMYSSLLKAMTEKAKAERKKNHEAMQASVNRIISDESIQQTSNDIINIQNSLLEEWIADWKFKHPGQPFDKKTNPDYLKFEKQLRNQ